MCGGQDPQGYLEKAYMGGKVANRGAADILCGRRRLRDRVHAIRRQRQERAARRATTEA